MDENRKSTRHRVLKAGKIAFGGAIVDCTVRNLSETGAALDVVSSVGIPDRFTLIVAVDRVQRPCRVAWRKATRIGVLFG
ncbi:PilZ domain-containing protein [Afipia felis]|uniref:PilZ domain-containing protein n=1 Tax=Afipia felis TaxID=1035 RepID=UPI000660F980|nr:PilZ domain-containing protein [Afipia felis]